MLGNVLSHMCTSFLVFGYSSPNLIAWFWRLDKLITCAPPLLVAIDLHSTGSDEEIWTYHREYGE